MIAKNVAIRALVNSARERGKAVLLVLWRGDAGGTAVSQAAPKDSSCGTGDGSRVCWSSATRSTWRGSWRYRNLRILDSIPAPCRFNLNENRISGRFCKEWLHEGIALESWGLSHSGDTAQATDATDATDATLSHNGDSRCNLRQTNFLLSKYACYSESSPRVMNCFTRNSSLWRLAQRRTASRQVVFQ